MLERRPFNPRTADVWALGVSLHVLLTSRLPFGGPAADSRDVNSDSRDHAADLGGSRDSTDPASNPRDSREPSSRDLRDLVDRRDSSARDTRDRATDPGGDVNEERALSMMRRGLDLSASGPSRSVRLSAAVVDLLRGLLHYVTEVPPPAGSTPRCSGPDLSVCRP